MSEVLGVYAKRDGDAFWRQNRSESYPPIDEDAGADLASAALRAGPSCRCLTSLAVLKNAWPAETRPFDVACQPQIG